MDFTSVNPATAFATIATFPDKAHGLLVLAGSTLLTHDEHEHVYFWNIEGTGVPIELRNAENQLERPLEAVVRNQFVIVARPSTLEIYGIQPMGSNAAVPIYPVAVHHWQWKLDSVCISRLVSWKATQTNKLAPVGILIRYSSLLPWPINLLHQYVLRPDLSYDSMNPVSENNLPYHPLPLLQRTIGSPIRLFASYHMSLGTHGMAVWIDSHTEDYFSQGDQGQRLAGTLLPAIDSGNDLDDGLDPQYKVESTVDSNVFDVSEVDKWVRVVVCEEEGKIVVGGNDGTISILEYI